MPRRISVHEAKTHLSQLIKALEHEASIIITSYGKPVATLSAANTNHKRIIGDLAKILKSPALPDDFDAPMPEAWFEISTSPLHRRRRRKK